LKTIGEFMGLDVSHGAFIGPYGSFDRFRQTLCEATGGTWPKRFSGSSYFVLGPGFDSESHPGLWELLNHSDCDGEISPEDCLKVAKDLKELLPELGIPDIRVAKKFIEGCELAASLNESLIFA
jgi:hypothetical protein